MAFVRFTFFAAAWLALESCDPAPPPGPRTTLEIIREAKSVNDARVGFGAQRTDVYEAYLVFKDESSKEELLGYTDDSNVNIRASAAKALRERFPEESFFGLLRDKLQDESAVSHFSGCSFVTMTMGDFYFSQFADSLTPEQQADIRDDLLAREHKHHGALFSILYDWNFPDRQLPRVRELFQSGKRQAIIALARSGKEQDLPTVIASVNDHEYLCYYAIESNPLPVFFDFLKERHSLGSSSTCRAQYLQALAAFKSPESLALLRQVFEAGPVEEVSREYVLKDLVKALQAHSDPIYEELLEKCRLGIGGF